MTPSIQPNCFCPSFSAKVPAITVQKVHHGAQLEGGLTVREKKYNVARDAYRAIGLLGIGWKIPKDIYSFKCEDGSFVDVHSLKPKNVLHYLMNSQPEVVLGHLGEASLKPFWTAYHGLHPTHEVWFGCVWSFPLFKAVPDRVVLILIATLCPIIIHPLVFLLLFLILHFHSLVWVLLRIFPKPFVFTLALTGSIFLS